MRNPRQLSVPQMKDTCTPPQTPCEPSTPSPGTDHPKKQREESWIVCNLAGPFYLCLRFTAPAAPFMAARKGPSFLSRVLSRADSPSARADSPERVRAASADRQPGSNMTVTPQEGSQPQAGAAAAGVPGLNAEVGAERPAAHTPEPG